MKIYLDLLSDIMTNGSDKGDRTGTGTLSLFGRQIRHNLNDGFPLLTSKKMHIKSIVHELLWMLDGGTNIQYLKDHGVSIWDEWATEEGDLGPLYGAQWTAWPAENGKTINQIDKVVEALKKNPNSRRIIINGWNVAYLPDENISAQENVKEGKMALPPCHLLYQFYVNAGKLSAQLYIRSSDSFLGLPYNIAALAFLTHMLAHQCDLTPHELIVSFGDVHAYNNHHAQITTQLQRDPRPLPSFRFARRPDSIYGYRFEDFIIEGYDPHPAIKGAVAI